MTFQFNNQEDSDHLEFDQLRTDHNISKILSFTNPLGKRGAVASLGGGATTKSKSNETGGIANHSMCYHHQGFRDCNAPLKSTKIQGGKQNDRHTNRLDR